MITETEVTLEGANYLLKKVYVLQKTNEYQVRPDNWLIEKFGGKITDLKWSEWPGYENHQWDGTPDPFYKAVMALKDGKNVAIESATGVGKSYIAARIAFWFLDVFPNSAVITTAPTKEQLLQVLWKEIAQAFPKFQKNKPDSVMITGEVRVNKKQVYKDEPGSKLDYSNRMISKVGKKVSGAESSVVFQGIHYVHQLFIFDEAPGIDHSIFTAADHTNTFKGEQIEIPEANFKGIAINSILALGNPDSVTDPLHRFSRQKDVVSIRVSAYDHPNVVLKKPIIPGAVTTESLRIRKEEYGEESNMFRSRGRGIAPEQATDALIQRKWFDQCCRYRPEFDRERFKDDPQSFPAVGVDVANSLNGDKAALVWGKGNRAKSIQEFQCDNATDLADNLVKDSADLQKENITDYGTKKLTAMGVSGRNVGVDGVGIGVATVNQLKRLGVTCQSLQGGPDLSAIPQVRENPKDINSPLKPMYSFASKRAQMYWQLRLDLQRVDFCIDIIDTAEGYQLLEELAEELTMIQYKVSDSHIVIEKKEDIKKRTGGKSPNKADAFVYWNWSRKDRSGNFANEMPVGYNPEYTEIQAKVSDQDFYEEPDGMPNIWRPEKFIR